MSGNGELLRSMRAGGGVGVAAAQELLRRARSGAVSRAELVQVKQVIATSPELKDAFKGFAAEVSALLDPGSEQVFRDVAQLSPDHERLTDARALPERFLADLQLVKGELLGHPGLTRQQKAERLFAFFEGYARRFGQLAHGTAQASQAATAPPLPAPLAAPALERALTQFERALRQAGFAELQTPDGQTGLAHALSRLGADAQAAWPPPPKGLDAPTWKDNAAKEQRLPAEVERERRAVATLDARGPQPPLTLLPGQAPARRLEGAAAAEPKPEPGRASRRSDKVLGSSMLWNVMHLLRGEDLDDVARRDALNELAVAAVLLFTFGAIIAVILVWV